jgi:hypothetical protein
MTKAERIAEIEMTLRLGDVDNGAHAQELAKELAQLKNN